MKWADKAYLKLLNIPHRHAVATVPHQLLGEKGLDVPDELIVYDDSKIDFSDCPEITDEDIAGHIGFFFGEVPGKVQPVTYQ